MVRTHTGALPPGTPSATIIHASPPWMTSVREAASHAATWKARPGGGGMHGTYGGGTVMLRSARYVQLVGRCGGQSTAGGTACVRRRVVTSSASTSLANVTGGAVPVTFPACRVPNPERRSPSPTPAALHAPPYTSTRSGAAGVAPGTVVAVAPRRAVDSGRPSTPVPTVTPTTVRYNVSTSGASARKAGSCAGTRASACGVSASTAASSGRLASCARVGPLPPASRLASGAVATPPNTNMVPAAREKAAAACVRAAAGRPTTRRGLYQPRLLPSHTRASAAALGSTPAGGRPPHTSTAASSQSAPSAATTPPTMSTLGVAL